MTYPIKTKGAYADGDDGFLRAGTVTTTSEPNPMTMQVNDQYFCRWANVNVPQGSKIIGASIQMPNSQIKGEAGAKYSASIENNINPAAATVTPVGRTYLPETLLTHASQPGYVRIDVTSQVQTMVNRGDWVSGGPMYGRVTITGAHPTATSMPNIFFGVGQYGSGVQLHVLYVAANWVEPVGPFLKDSHTNLNLTGDTTERQPTYSFIYGDTKWEAPFHEVGDWLVAWVSCAENQVPTFTGITMTTIAQLHPTLGAAGQHANLVILAGRITTPLHHIHMTMTGNSAQGYFEFMTISNVLNAATPWTVKTASGTGSSFSTGAHPLVQAAPAVLAFAYLSSFHRNSINIAGLTGQDTREVSNYHIAPVVRFARGTGGTSATYSGTGASSYPWSAAIMEFTPETPPAPTGPNNKDDLLMFM